MGGNVPGSLDRLRSALASPAALERVVAGRPGQGGRTAAVLILLSFDADAAGREPGVAAGLRCVFIEKAAHLRRHAGQIGFPGGAIEPADGSKVAAALREAEEEVGVRPSEVSVLGVLPPAHVAASNFDATAVVGWWPRPRPLVPHDVGEIAAVHDLPLPLLVDPAARSTARHPSGYAGPAFVVGDLYIWGFTAHLLAGLFELAGWGEAWDAGRFSEIPSRFLHGRR